MSKQITEIITERIIEALEKGDIPWKKTWINAPKNSISKKEYRGINRLLLSMTDFNSPYFLTFKQARDLGGYVKKGSRGIPVVYWHLCKVRKNEEEEMTEISEKTIPFMRYYIVFNIEQVEGIDKSKFTEHKRDFKPVETCKNIVKGYKDSPVILHQGFQPAYIPAIDTVEIPLPENFTSEENYYSTLFHELTHSTGHKNRLDRKEVAFTQRFGSCNYAEEELVAEIGASFLCSYAGIENTTIDNSTAYIQGWLKVLNDDRKMIINAASRAEKSMKHIMGK
jgi:antirestriction protein ArdC